MAFRRIGKALLPVASGVLAALALPGLGAGPLVFVALVPWFWALEERHGFRSSFLFAAVLFALDFRWVLTLYRFTPLIALGYVLLVAYLAVPVGVAGILLSWVRRRRGPVAFLIVATAAMTLLEFLRSLGPLGIGFSALHLALYHTPVLVQLAAYAGPLAITACIVLCNAGLYLFLRERRPAHLVAVAVGLAVLALPALAPISPDSSPAERVAVVASTVAQEARLNSRNVPALADRYLRLGNEAIAGEPDLVAFPESFLPSYILQSPDVFDRFADLARRGETFILFGTGNWRDGRVYNSAVLVDPTGAVAGVYDMLRPVPFGEFVPGRSIWEALGLGGLMSSLLPMDLTPGTDVRPIGGMGTPICFESTFAAGSRDLVRGGATLLVTVTNDAWFVGSSELPTHFAFGVFRAVENRRWFIQAANGGISGIVAPDGRVARATSAEEILSGDVYHRSDVTVYARLGDLPILAVLGIAAAVALLVRQSRKSEGE
ncbi:MAG: apolipoprotein N-acyltransferase [Thermotogota bacterium]